MFVRASYKQLSTSRRRAQQAGAKGYARRSFPLDFPCLPSDRAAKSFSRMSRTQPLRGLYACAYL